MTADDDSPDPATAPSSPIRDDDGRLSPAFLATLVAIPVMIIVGFITFAALRDAAGSPLDGMAAQPGTEKACAPLMEALPTTLGAYADKSASGSAAKWRASNGDAVHLRCGVVRPPGLVPSSRLQVVDSAQWFITDDRDNGVAYVAVDHRPYVALWLPMNSGTAPISDVTALIDKHLERAPLELG